MVSVGDEVEKSRLKTYVFSRVSPSVVDSSGDDRLVISRTNGVGHSSGAIVFTRSLIQAIALSFMAAVAIVWTMSTVSIVSTMSRSTRTGRPSCWKGTRSSTPGRERRGSEVTRETASGVRPVVMTLIVSPMLFALSENCQQSHRGNGKLVQHFVSGVNILDNVKYPVQKVLTRLLDLVIDTKVFLLSKDFRCGS